jgi:hypothetical protein
MRGQFHRRGGDVDFTQLVKIYGPSQESETHYSPAQCIGTEKHKIIGNPDPGSISTCYVERQNLTIENLSYAVALHFMYYDFLPDSSDLESNPSDGSRDYGSCLGN